MELIPIIILGHGDFPVAIKNSAQLLIGKREKIYTLCLHEGDGLDNFIEKTTHFFLQFGSDTQLLVFVDLQGGTPWNAVLGINDPRIWLITGINLPMLIEVLNLRDQKASIDELVKCALESAKISVVSKNFK